VLILLFKTFKVNAEFIIMAGHMLLHIWFFAAAFWCISARFSNTNVCCIFIMEWTI